MTQPLIIDHPITGEPVTFAALAAETGIRKDTLRYRYSRLGYRGDQLITPIRPGYESRRGKKPRRAGNDQNRADTPEWRRSSAGRLSTRLLRDYARPA